MQKHADTLALFRDRLRPVCARLESLDAARVSVISAENKELAARVQVLEEQLRVMAKPHDLLASSQSSAPAPSPEQQQQPAHTAEDRAELILITSTVDKQVAALQREIEQLRRLVAGLHGIAEKRIDPDELTYEVRQLMNLQGSGKQVPLLEFLLASLRNIPASPTAKRFPHSAMALWLLMFNHGKARVFRPWSQNLLGPSYDGVRKLASTTYMEPGITQEMADGAAAYFIKIGIDLDTCPFQISVDATRLDDRVQYDAARGGILGYVGAQPQPFETWQQALDDYKRLEIAKFVLLFVITPLDPNLASAYRILAALAQPGTFPTSYIQICAEEVRECARRGGFRHVIISGADGDSRHRRLTLQLMRNEAGKAVVGPQLSGLLNLYPIPDGFFFYVMGTDHLHLIKKVTLSS